MTDKKEKAQIRTLKVGNKKTPTCKDRYDFFEETFEDARVTFGKIYQATLTRHDAIENICIKYWEVKQNGQL